MSIGNNWWNIYRFFYRRYYVGPLVLFLKTILKLSRAAEPAARATRPEPIQGGIRVHAACVSQHHGRRHRLGTNCTVATPPWTGARRTWVVITARPAYDGRTERVRSRFIDRYPRALQWSIDRSIDRKSVNSGLGRRKRRRVRTWGIRSSRAARRRGIGNRWRPTRGRTLDCTPNNLGYCPSLTSEDTAGRILRLVNFFSIRTNTHHILGMCSID